MYSLIPVAFVSLFFFFFVFSPVLVRSFLSCCSKHVGSSSRSSSTIPYLLRTQTSPIMFWLSAASHSHFKRTSQSKRNLVQTSSCKRRRVSAEAYLMGHQKSRLRVLAFCSLFLSFWLFIRFQQPPNR